MGRAAEAWLEEDSPSHPFPAAVSHGACYYYSAATTGSGDPLVLPSHLALPSS